MDLKEGAVHEKVVFGKVRWRTPVFKKFTWRRNGREGSIICEVTKVCGRVEKEHGYE